MKLLLKISVLFVFAFTSYAQIGVGPIEMVKFKSGQFSEESLNKLKTSKTVFVYRPSDDKEKLEKAIREVWKITDISLVPFSEMKNQDLTNISVFSIAGVNNKYWNTSINLNYDNTHIYLNLWMQGKNKKGKSIKESFCRIELHPTFVDYWKVTGSSKNALSYLYNEGQLKNWNVGFLKSYLKTVNDLIEKGEERWLYLTQNRNPKMKGLADKTLYIPDYAMVKFNKFTGDESKKLAEAKIFKSYPHKYEIISAEQLSKKILNSDESFYYLVYVKSSTDKYISVFDSLTGEMIYSAYDAKSYNMKESDLKSIAKAISVH